MRQHHVARAIAHDTYIVSLQVKHAGQNPGDIVTRPSADGKGKEDGIAFGNFSVTRRSRRQGLRAYSRPIRCPAPSRSQSQGSFRETTGRDEWIGSTDISIDLHVLKAILLAFPDCPGEN
jgi:hypothetical protein